MSSTIALLRRLERTVRSFGGEAAAEKRELLRALDRARLPDARAVLRFHECLCFLRAYPDDPETLARVERCLTRFASRRDLRLHREALADSGIAGTPIRYSFYWATARWLARRWPDRLAIEWTDFDRVARLEDLLDLLLTESEAPALDEWDHGAREWIRMLKARGERDGAFLVNSFAGLPLPDAWRERLFESLDTPFRLDSGEGTPSRTLAGYRTARVSYQSGSLERSRPDLLAELDRPPLRVRALTPAEGDRLIDLARGAMVTRSRDLDVFANADRRDVRLVECGSGLEFACFGVLPERRLLLEAVYGFLTLKNGVPVGYVLASALFDSSEVAYNVFETFRDAEAGPVYGRVLAVLRHLFGSDSFCVDPYQLGHHNAEGLRSGAWWFYYKLGLRPRDAGVRRVLREELRCIRADPTHRSDLSTLKKLVVAPVFFYSRGERDDVMGRFSPGAVGMHLARYLGARFGAARRRGLVACADEAARLLGLRSRRDFSRGERVAWERWSPLVLLLPGAPRWSRADRRALVRVIRAKGGPRESDFVARFNAHRRLREALLELGGRP